VNKYRKKQRHECLHTIWDPFFTVKMIEKELKTDRNYPIGYIVRLPWFQPLRAQKFAACRMTAATRPAVRATR